MPDADQQSARAARQDAPSPTQQDEPTPSANQATPPAISHGLLNFGFCVGLFLACLCLGGGFCFLRDYQSQAYTSINTLLTTNAHPDVLVMAIHSRNIQARLSLQACGVFIGMAFAFLGVCLFLLGVKGQVNLEAVGYGAQLKTSNLLPGVLVIVCGAVLVGVSVTHTTPYHFSTPTFSDSPEPGKMPTSPTGPKPEAGNDAKGTSSTPTGAPAPPPPAPGDGFGTKGNANFKAGKG